MGNDFIKHVIMCTVEEISKFGNILNTQILIYENVPKIKIKVCHK